ncbi:hypothetical protein BX616_006874, partial [Lobosporangium transversale]
AIMAPFGFVNIYGIFHSQYLDIYRARGASDSSVAIIQSLAAGFQYGFAVVSGPLMNRFGYKVVFWSGTIIGSLGLLLASWATQLWHLYLTLGVMLGIGISFLSLAVTAVPPLWYKKHRSLAMGIIYCGSGTGGVVFGFVVPALINAVGLSWTLRIYAIFHFVCTAFASIVMRVPRQLSGPPIVVHKTMINFQILKDPGFVFLIMSAALFGFGCMVPFLYIPAYAKDVVGLDPNVQGGQLLSLMSAAYAVAVITVGYAADRLGAIRVTIFVFMVTGASCFLWMFSHSYAALACFSIMYGFFSSGFFTSVVAITASTVGLANLGSGMTMIFLVSTPGSLLTLPIASKILEYTGNYKAMIGYNAAMYFGTAFFLCLFMIYSRYAKRADNV